MLRLALEELINYETISIATVGLPSWPCLRSYMLVYLEWIHTSRWLTWHVQQEKTSESCDFSYDFAGTDKMALSSAGMAGKTAPSPAQLCCAGNPKGYQFLRSGNPNLGTQNFCYFEPCSILEQLGPGTFSLHTLLFRLVLMHSRLLCLQCTCLPRLTSPDCKNQFISCF